jgi:hypothetical protein
MFNILKNIKFKLDAYDFSFKFLYLRCQLFQGTWFSQCLTCKASLRKASITGFLSYEESIPKIMIIIVMKMWHPYKSGLLVALEGKGEGEKYIFRK